MRRDGVPLGWCAEHRSARLRSAAIGTVRPGPRGRGWRVKQAVGWVPSTQDGRPLARAAQRTDLAQVLDRTRDVIHVPPIAQLCDRCIADAEDEGDL